MTQLVCIADCAAPVDRIAALAAADPSLIVQLRDREATGRALFERARELVAIGARVLVNDRLDVALAAGALGVHLPEHGLDVATARALGARFVGVSRHTPEAAAAAEAAGADLVILGPIFSKAAIGVGAITEALTRMSGRALLCAIGGIDATNAAQVLAAGADGVAAIRYWWTDTDAASAIRQIRGW